MIDDKGAVTPIKGGVCAAEGYRANGVHCGMRKNKIKKDISVVLSDVVADCAAVFTTNRVKGAPLIVTGRNIADGKAQAIICNSGNANTCCADGEEKAEAICVLTADTFGISPKNVVVASTGVIGVPLDLNPVKSGLKALKEGISYDNGSAAADGILTTDTRRKEAAVSFKIDGKLCKLGGMAKGTGMLHPNMATVIVFITTDCAISSNMIKKALSHDVQSTFNMVSIDGDTSTNDMVLVMANGLAGNKRIEEEGEAFGIFMKALNSVTVSLCRMIAGDGEGATRMIECRVRGAEDIGSARLAARSVITSKLVKSMIFGADANWGRVLCAVGYSGASFEVESVSVAFESEKGRVEVCENGVGKEFSEAMAKEILSESEILIDINFNSGSAEATAWGCDLTYDYVRITGDYRK